METQIPCMHWEIQCSRQSGNKEHFQKYSLDHAVLLATSNGFPIPDKLLFTIVLLCFFFNKLGSSWKIEHKVTKTDVFEPPTKCNYLIFIKMVWHSAAASVFPFDCLRSVSLGNLWSCQQITIITKAFQWRIFFSKKKARRGQKWARKCTERRYNLHSRSLNPQWFLFCSRPSLKITKQTESVWTDQNYNSCFQSRTRQKDVTSPCRHLETYLLIEINGSHSWDQENEFCWKGLFYFPEMRVLTAGGNVFWILMQIVHVENHWQPAFSKPGWPGKNYRYSFFVA